MNGTPVAPEPAGYEDLGVISLGPFGLDCIRTEVREGQRTYPHGVDELATQHWSEVLRLKPNLFDGPVWGLIQQDIEEVQGGSRGIKLLVQQSSYRFVLYTHFTEEGRVMRPSDRCGALGLMSFTESSDGFLIVGRRSMKLGQMPGFWHCIPAGNVDGPDMLAVLKKELREELAVDLDSETTGGSLLSTLTTGPEQGDKLELSFHITVSLTASEMLARLQNAVDRGEHERVAVLRILPDVPVPDDIDSDDTLTVDEYVNAVGQCACGVTDVSRRALQVFLRLRGSGVI